MLQSFHVGLHIDAQMFLQKWNIKMMKRAGHQPLYLLALDVTSRRQRWRCGIKRTVKSAKFVAAHNFCKTRAKVAGFISGGSALHHHLWSLLQQFLAHLELSPSSHK